MPSGSQIIIALKILVVAVSVLFALSLVALASGRRTLHGRINLVFFVLTGLTVLAFEAVLQAVNVSEVFSPEARRALHVHLYFSVPSTLLLPVMLVTGKMHLRRVHTVLGVLFTALWTGTVITGLGLPH
jgi:hypothetical protein